MSSAVSVLSGVTAGQVAAQHQKPIIIDSGLTIKEASQVGRRTVRACCAPGLRLTRAVRSLRNTRSRALPYTIRPTIRSRGSLTIPMSSALS